MRHRIAAIVLTAAVCGLIAPARAADSAADLSKYMPEGAGFYVHVNVQQFLAAPVVRKAVPMAINKYGDAIMQFAQIAKMFDPNAAKVSNDDIQKVLDELKKPETIAKGFDAAKNAVTDIVVAGDPGHDDQFVLIIKCHEAVTSDMVKQFAPLLGANPQFQLKTHEKGKSSIFEAKTPQQPQSFFFGLPDAGVVVGGISQEVVEKAMAGKAGGFKGDLKKLVAERKKSDFIFFAVTGKDDDETAVRSGWGRLVLDKDISGEMSGTFTNPKKATDEAKEMNEHISQLAETVKGALGDHGKDIAAALEKAKAVADGSTVKAKFTLPGSVIEKLLSKDKE
jgi:hypothetical protein